MFSITKLGVGERKILNLEDLTFKYKHSSVYMELATIQIEHFHLNYKPVVSAAYLDSSPACRCLYELVI